MSTKPLPTDINRPIDFERDSATLWREWVEYLYAQGIKESHFASLDHHDGIKDVWGWRDYIPVLIERAIDMINIYNIDSSTTGEGVSIPKKSIMEWVSHYLRGLVPIPCVCDFENIYPLDY